jgi:hypothetical protein
VCARVCCFISVSVGVCCHAILAGAVHAKDASVLRPARRGVLLLRERASRILSFSHHRTYCVLLSHVLRNTCDNSCNKLVLVNSAECGACAQAAWHQLQ